MTDNKNHLGRLEVVDLRTVWTSEDGDFTPWLAKEENLALPGDTIGLELELEAQEKNVGPFRAGVLYLDAYSISQNPRSVPWSRLIRSDCGRPLQMPSKRIGAG